jgi:hypothetical protein
MNPEPLAGCVWLDTPGKVLHVEASRLEFREDAPARSRSTRGERTLTAGFEGVYAAVERGSLVPIIRGHPALPLLVRGAQRVHLTLE